MYLPAFRLLWSTHSSLQQLLSLQIAITQGKKTQYGAPRSCGPGIKRAVIERIIIHVRHTQAEEVAKELNEKNKS